MKYLGFPLPELETIYPICARGCRKIRDAKFLEDIRYIICNRPREKVRQVGIFFLQISYYLAVHIFAENLVWLARCVAKIRLLLCPVDRKPTSAKKI